jgi:hypothetical protein
VRTLAHQIVICVAMRFGGLDDVQKVVGQSTMTVPNEK